MAWTDTMRITSRELRKRLGGAAMVLVEAEYQSLLMGKHTENGYWKITFLNR